MSEANIYLEHQPSAIIIIPLKPIPTAMFNDQLNSRRKTVYSEFTQNGDWQSPNDQVARIAFTWRGFSELGRASRAESKRSSCAQCPAGGAVRRPRQAATHLPKLQIRPRGRAIPRPFWGTMAMQDSVTTMREQAVRVSECARECESKQNRSRLASGTMGRCNAVRAVRPCLAGVLSGLSDPVASYRRASARVLHSNRRQRPELTVFGARASRERSV
ncbi:unnamed protein product [Clavelina lepadiformis]|uniref:Uncharacterized protein n=1 Tax=Clavelina lepadiformis TaxID=159417 RepID=A0ABP0FC89_CLALP